MPVVGINLWIAKLTKMNFILGCCIGEEGSDWGGLYRDALERAVDDLFSTSFDLFIPCPNAVHNQGFNTDKYIPNPKHAESPIAQRMYRFVGQVIGSIYQIL